MGWHIDAGAKHHLLWVQSWLEVLPMSKGQRSGDWPPALIALSDPAYAVVHEPPKGADGVSPLFNPVPSLLLHKPEYSGAALVRHMQQVHAGGQVAGGNVEAVASGCSSGDVFSGKAEDVVIDSEAVEALNFELFCNGVGQQAEMVGAASGFIQGVEKGAHAGQWIQFDGSLWCEVFTGKSRIIGCIPDGPEYGVLRRVVALRDGPLYIDGAHIAPNFLPVWCHFKEQTVVAFANEGIVVGQALCAGDVGRVEALWRVGHVGPCQVVWPVRQVRIQQVVAVGQEGCGNFVNGGDEPGGAVNAIVENQHMAGTGQPVGNPVGVVRAEEGFIGGGAPAVGFGVAPAVEQVAAAAAVAAGGAGRLGCGGAVVDDVELVEAAGAEDDLIQVGIVRKAVAVYPVGKAAGAAAGAGAVVDVQFFGVVGWVAVVGQVGVEILHNVVDGVPFPHDFGAVAADGFQFHDGFGPEALVVDEGGVAAQVNGFLLRNLFPCQHEDVAVGQGLNIVVLVVIGRGIIVRPDEVAVPVVFFDAATGAASVESTRDASRAKQVSVFEQVGRYTRAEIALPTVDELAAIVDQVGGSGTQRCKERVAVESQRIVQEQSDRLLAVGRQAEEKKEKKGVK